MCKEKKKGGKISLPMEPVTSLCCNLDVCGSVVVAGWHDKKYYPTL